MGHPVTFVFKKFDCTGKEEQVNCLRVFLLLPRATRDSQRASQIHQLNPREGPLPEGYRTKRNQGRKKKQIPQSYNNLPPELLHSPNPSVFYFLTRNTRCI